MSTCISRHGEFSSHTLPETGAAEERFVCTLCFAIAEPDVYDEIDRLTGALAQAERDLEGNVQALKINVTFWRERAEKAEAEVQRIATQRDEFECEKDGAWAEVQRLHDGITALADEFEPSLLGTDFFGNPIGGFVPAAKLRALLDGAQ